MDTWEFEHPSVCLFKQEVSRKRSILIRGTKGGTGKATADSKPEPSAGKQLTAPEIQTLCSFKVGSFLQNLIHFFKKHLESPTLIHEIDRNGGEQSNVTTLPVGKRVDLRKEAATNSPLQKATNTAPRYQPRGGLHRDLESGQGGWKDEILRSLWSLSWRTVR